MSAIEWEKVGDLGWMVSVGGLTIELSTTHYGADFATRIDSEPYYSPLEQTTEAEAKDAALDAAIQSLRVALRDCERVRRSSDGSAARGGT